MVARKVFSRGVTMGRSRALASVVAASAALAVCLLAVVAVQPAGAAFPGQNGKIAFQSNRAGNNIHTINPTGGRATNLTRSDGNGDPAYSPDGGRIAFVSGGTGGNDIFVMNADGSGRRQLPSTASADSEPAWSPDGTRIAFVSNTFSLDGETTDPLLSDPEIWMMNADGSNQHPITSNSYLDTHPAWSPDGTRIAFESSRRDLGDTDGNIYVMDANGNNQTNITKNSPLGCSSNCYQGGDNDPAWSPDGKKIAYVHGYGPPENPNAAGGKPNIWTMDPNGDNRTNVSNNSDVSAFMPAWSPDGARIAYVGVVGAGFTNIHVMNANGTGQDDPPIPIDSNDANDTNPDWQPVPVCTRTVNAANDPLVGTTGKDVLCGDARANTINGAGGNDIVLAKGGNDKLTGALGNDTLNGGPGTDTALYSGATAVKANLTTEFATGVGSDVLLGIDNLSGSSVKDQFTGSGGRNVLSGLGGNDVLDARDGISGNDKVNGGTGASDTCRRDAGDIMLNCP